MLAYSVRSVTDIQLIQDKICKFDKNMTVEFCERLSKIGENPDDPQADLDMKSSIIVEASKFQMYYMGLQFLPSVIVCLFLGSWCDNYLYGRKILLLISAVGILLETIIKAYMATKFELNYKYLILAAVPSALGGGLGTSFTAIFSYIPATTPHNLRAIRFMLVEAILFLATPVSGILGGYLLNTTKYYKWEPIGKNHQLMNYNLVYIASAVFSVISFFWVIYFVDEVRDKKQLEKFDLNKVHQDLYVPTNNLPRPLPEEKPKKNPFLMLFDCGNVMDIIKTCTKRRPNKARKQLWLIIVSILLYLLSNIGPLYIMYPFAQKVYLWDSSDFSIWNSLATFANSIGTVTATLLLTKFFKVDDLPLAIIGVTGYFAASVIRGSIQNLYGFYAGAIVGSVGPIGNVGMRSYLSRIIDKDELGKVFSMIASLDATAPILANIVFTLIFTQTLDYFPGAVFEATAALLFVPLFVLFWIDINCNNDSDTIDSNGSRKTKGEPKHKINANATDERNNPLTYRTKHSGVKVRTTDL